MDEGNRFWRYRKTNSIASSISTVPCCTGSRIAWWATPTKRKILCRRRFDRLGRAAIVMKRGGETALGWLPFCDAVLSITGENDPHHEPLATPPRWKSKPPASTRLKPDIPTRCKRRSQAYPPPSENPYFWLSSAS